ncbi:hypothetical protein ACSBR1_020374 [Camellia fascicularis]
MSLGSCLLPLLFAVALTGACSTSLNVFARSSGFLVLRGVIRFGGLVRSVRRGTLALTCLRVACAFRAGKHLAKIYVPRLVVAIWLSLTCLQVSCLRFPSGSCLAKSMSLGRANRCLPGFPECFRTFVWLLSPSGCDSFRGGWCVVYVVARELCLVCASWMDPCLCSELLWCISLHLRLGARFCLLPRVGSCVAYLKKRNSVRIVCLYSSRHLVALGEPQSISRVLCCPLTLPCRGMARGQLYLCSRIQSLVRVRAVFDLRFPAKRSSLVAGYGRACL